MQEAFVDVNGVPTHVMTWGAWIEEDISKYNEIVLCIPGNPGIPAFYTRFLAEIHNQLGSNIPVWIIGHAGHDEPSKDSLRKIPSLEGNHSIYDLQGQIEHKKQFIKKYVPENTKIHFIGHSIGSYMILNLLDDPEMKVRDKFNYLLFPTIEKMAESSNGKTFMHILKPFIRFVEFILIIFNFLPESVRCCILYVYFMFLNIPKEYMEPAIKYLTVSIARKIYFLAVDEMLTVVDLNLNQVEEVLPKTKFYYGPNDKWAPKEYFLRLKARFPQSNAELCERNISHAFVIWSANEMGTMVSRWILENERNIK